LTLSICETRSTADLSLQLLPNLQQGRFDRRWCPTLARRRLSRRKPPPPPKEAVKPPPPKEAVKPPPPPLLSPPPLPQTELTTWLPPHLSPLSIYIFLTLYSLEMCSNISNILTMLYFQDSRRNTTTYI
ncbi:unnamed protein product, partial [Brassica oleracea]